MSTATSTTTSTTSTEICTANNGDCPICMDVIEENKNCVTTECGHRFHTSCLMTNVVHNGFGCPYCRTTMAKHSHSHSHPERMTAEPNYYPYDEESGSDYSDEDEDDEEEQYNEDYVLRGFRFMNNNLEGQTHDPEDIQEEEEDETRTATTMPSETQRIPDAAYIAKRLFEDGINMEKIIKCLMYRHEEYQFEELDNIDNEIYDKMCTYIERFSEDNIHNDEDETTQAHQTPTQRYATFGSFMIPMYPSRVYTQNQHQTIHPTPPPELIV